MPDPLLESKTAEAVHAAAVHAEAVERARVAQTDEAVVRGLERFFETRVAKGRFIDTGRIPFICDDLEGIHRQVENINTLIWRFIWALLSLLGIILIGLGGWAFTILVNVSHG